MLVCCVGIWVLFFNEGVFVVTASAEILQGIPLFWNVGFWFLCVGVLISIFYFSRLSLPNCWDIVFSYGSCFLLKVLVW